MPAKERPRSDEEAFPALAGEHTSRRRQEDPVQPPEPRSTGRLARKDLHLVAENQDLDLALTTAFRGWHETEKATDEQVEDRAQHHRILREHSV